MKGEKQQPPPPGSLDCDYLEMKFPMNQRKGHKVKGIECARDNFGSYSNYTYWIQKRHRKGKVREIFIQLRKHKLAAGWWAPNCLLKKKAGEKTVDFERVP